MGLHGTQETSVLLGARRWRSVLLWLLGSALLGWALLIIPSQARAATHGFGSMPGEQYFEVMAGADTEAPVFQSLSFSPATVDTSSSSQTVTVTAHITDNQSRRGLGIIHLVQKSRSIHNAFRRSVLPRLGHEHRRYLPGYGDLPKEFDARGVDREWCSSR